jgi:hypothetical protein
MAIINGTSGNDRLEGTIQNDIINGLDGNDFFTNSDGSDLFKGGTGNDSYYIEIQPTFAAGGVIIDDAGGSQDFLRINKIVNAPNTLTKSGTTLQIDLNNNQKFEADKDLSILNFFNDAGGAGTGFIESIRNGIDSPRLLGSPAQVAEVIDVLSIFNSRVQPKKGDFNRDNRTDIVWRRGDGGVTLWQSNGSNPIASNIADKVDTSWQIIDTANFDGDNKQDILWYNNDSGAVARWKMDGANILSQDYLSQGVDTSWKIAGTGNFNSDSKTDIFWRNANGDVAIWQMDGTKILSSTVLGKVDAQWKFVSSGDFNGDGKSDIIWQNSQGDVAMWLMDGTKVIFGDVISRPGVEWKISGVTDFDNDGKSDVLLYTNKDSILYGGYGRVALWKFDGSTATYSKVIGLVDSDIPAVAAGDFNGDSKGDILFHSSTTNAFMTTNGQELDGNFYRDSIFQPNTDPSWTLAVPNLIAAPSLI